MKGVAVEAEEGAEVDLDLDLDLDLIAAPPVDKRGGGDGRGNQRSADAGGSWSVRMPRRSWSTTDDKKIRVAWISDIATWIPSGASALAVRRCAEAGRTRCNSRGGA